GPRAAPARPRAPQVAALSDMAGPSLAVGSARAELYGIWRRLPRPVAGCCAENHQARQRATAADRSAGSAPGTKPKSWPVLALNSSLAFNRTTSSWSWRWSIRAGTTIASGRSRPRLIERARTRGAGLVRSKKLFGAIEHPGPPTTVARIPTANP